MTESSSSSCNRRGDALLFVSHKYHCVQPVTRGTRRVLVLEFWRWPERRCGHRCEVAAMRRCPREAPLVSSSSSSCSSSCSSSSSSALKVDNDHGNLVGDSQQENIGSCDLRPELCLRDEGNVDVSACLPLPMRLGNVANSEGSSTVKRILWQSNEVQAGKFTAPKETLDKANEAWDLFD
ncbi:unnamed protein product [Amoebophrya sp. A25]|nr:unnamed protein product [Amoebophrya sp. A25]|eukprot:GSA25T00016674001.1